MEKNRHVVHYSIVLFFIVFGFFYCLALIRFNDYDSCEEELKLSWFVSDALISFVIPFVIIAVVNFFIIEHLRTNYKNNKNVLLLQVSKRETSRINSLSRGTMPISNCYEANPNSRLLDGHASIRLHVSNDEILSQKIKQTTFDSMLVFLLGFF